MNPTEPTAVVDRSIKSIKYVGYYDLFGNKEVAVSLTEKPTLWKRFWWKALFGVDWTDL